MTIFRLNKDNFEVFSIQTRPKRSYISGSNGFKTGSVPVFPRASLIEREWIRKGFVDRLTPFDDSGISPAVSVQAKLTAAAQNAVYNVINVLDPTSASYKDVAGLIAGYLSGSYVDPGIQQLRSDANNYIFENINRIDPVKEITSKVRSPLQPYFFDKAQFTGSSGVKSYIRNSVFPYHRSIYPDLQFAYTNYNCLNFFTASSVQPNTVLLYPASDLETAERGLTSATKNVYDGPFSPSEAFTFDFYINPKYTTDDPAEDAASKAQGYQFKAGTIFHLSSSYAISLVTGSSTDVNGYADRYRIMIQLSRSADLSPSNVQLDLDTRTFPNDLIFLSDDNSLKRNHWHHVAIRWMPKTTTETLGVGSFYVDEDKKGEFQIPSASIAAGFNNDADVGLPNVLCIGNYYQGNNLNSGVGSDNRMSLFFTPTVMETDGLIVLSDESETAATPYGDYFFENPLNAEVHDLKIFKEFRSDIQTFTSSMQGPDPEEFIMNGGKLGFYVPPFFTKESPTRTYHRTSLVTTTATRKSSEDPINVDLSYRVAGREINLENFVRNFTTNTGSYPRLLNLTSSAITSADSSPVTHEMTDANDIMFRTGSHVKKCLSILPCDNGLFRPNMDILVSGSMEGPIKKSSQMSKFVNDLNNLDLSKITLATSMSYAHNFFGFNPNSGDTGNSPFLNQGGEIFSGSNIIGSTPGDLATLLTDDISQVPQAYGAWPTNPIGVPNTSWVGTGLWAVFQEQGDRISNEITIFSISNLFFGDRIRPGSFKMENNSVTGSDGKIKMTLRDNGHGVLYRADALTQHSKNSAVGNIVYTEGMAVIMSPHAFLYGKDGFNVDFTGERNIHVLKISANAAANMVNSSSNPNYRLISASFNANDEDQQFVYITGINFHDENLNVVMKTKLAQPVLKRSGDKILFKSKLDF